MFLLLWVSWAVCHRLGKKACRYLRPKCARRSSTCKYQSTIDSYSESDSTRTALWHEYVVPSTQYTRTWTWTLSRLVLRISTHVRPYSILKACCYARRRLHQPESSSGMHKPCEVQVHPQKIFHEAVTLQERLLISQSLSGLSSLLKALAAQSNAGLLNCPIVSAIPHGSIRLFMSNLQLNLHDIWRKLVAYQQYQLRRQHFSRYCAGTVHNHLSLF